MKIKENKGITFYPESGLWRARIGINGKRKHLGYFNTREDALKIYNNAAIEEKKKRDLNFKSNYQQNYNTKNKPKNKNLRQNPLCQSGYYGVTWNKLCGKWKTSIMINKNIICLGHFNDAEDAAIAYKEAAIKYGKEDRANEPLSAKEYAKKYETNNKLRIQTRTRNRRWNIKLEMIKAYGGKCECCGETKPEFMTIDHIYGGGGKHRKEIGVGSRFYQILKEQNWPKDKYRLLCFNCNSSYGHFGYCSHKITREEYYNA